MRKSIAGFLLIITLPLLCQAEVPAGTQRSPVRPSDTETLGETNGEAADTQSVAYDICLRATQRFL